MGARGVLVALCVSLWAMGCDSAPSETATAVAPTPTVERGDAGDAAPAINPVERAKVHGSHVLLAPGTELSADKAGKQVVIRLSDEMPVPMRLLAMGDERVELSTNLGDDQHCYPRLKGSKGLASIVWADVGSLMEVNTRPEVASIGAFEVTFHPGAARYEGELVANGARMPWAGKSFERTYTPRTKVERDGSYVAAGAVAGLGFELGPSTYIMSRGKRSAGRHFRVDRSQKANDRLRIVSGCLEVDAKLPEDEAKASQIASLLGVAPRRVEAGAKAYWPGGAEAGKVDGAMEIGFRKGVAEGPRTCFDLTQSDSAFGGLAALGALGAAKSDGKKAPAEAEKPSWIEYREAPTPKAFSVCFDSSALPRR